MDLILWRHADAEDGPDAPSDDLKRKLTPRGERQASRMALWLHRQTPDGLRILGAIRAAKQCVDCHGGERGALLGAFSYTLTQRPK